MKTFQGQPLKPLIEILEEKLELISLNTLLTNEEKENQSKPLQDEIDLYYECEQASFESEHC